ncbi:MAG: MarR family transcriptional regulator, partial [Pseudomonadota bacterium]
MSKLPFGFEQPEDSPGFLLWQTTTVWQRQIKKVLETHEISHAQFVVMAIALWFSAHHDAPTQTSIIQLSKLDKMTVSKALKLLEVRKLIHRAEDKSDTRAKTVTLTKTGESLIQIL